MNYGELPGYCRGAFFVNWQDFSFNFYFYQYIFLLFSMLKFTQTQVECTSWCRFFRFAQFQGKKETNLFFTLFVAYFGIYAFVFRKMRKNWCKKYWKRWVSFNFFYIANTFVFKMLWYLSANKTLTFTIETFHIRLIRSFLSSIYWQKIRFPCIVFRSTRK